MYKLMLLSLFIIGLSECIPQPNSATSPADSPSNAIDENTEVAENVTSVEKVQITVFYETFCPYSISFFIEQLAPTVSKLGPYLDLQLVPYGKAQTSNDTDPEGRYNFTCQHGKQECLGNLAHACVIDVLPNSTVAVIINTCLMLHSYYVDQEDINKCAAPEGVSIESIEEIKKCINGTKGSILLKSYGELTKANKVPYVPHLRFHGLGEQDREARKHLISSVCSMLIPKPQECLDS